MKVIPPVLLILALCPAQSALIKTEIDLMGTVKRTSLSSDFDGSHLDKLGAGETIRILFQFFSEGKLKDGLADHPAHLIHVFNAEGDFLEEVYDPYNISSVDQCSRILSGGFYTDDRIDASFEVDRVSGLGQVHFSGNGDWKDPDGYDGLYYGSLSIDVFSVSTNARCTIPDGGATASLALLSMVLIGFLHRTPWRGA